MQSIDMLANKGRCSVNIREVRFTVRSATGQSGAWAGDLGWDLGWGPGLGTWTGSPGWGPGLGTWAGDLAGVY